MGGLRGLMIAIREKEMDSVGRKLDLQELGTRYDHYMELKEVFMTGIEVIDGMIPAHRSEGDIATKKRLEAAVDAIDRRLLYLSDYTIETSPWSEFRKEINEVEIRRKSEQSKRKLLGEGDVKQAKDSGVTSGPTATQEPPDDSVGM